MERVVSSPTVIVVEIINKLSHTISKLMFVRETFHFILEVFSFPSSYYPSVVTGREKKQVKSRRKRITSRRLNGTD